MNEYLLKQAIKKEAGILNLAKGVGGSLLRGSQKLGGALKTEATGIGSATKRGFQTASSLTNQARIRGTNMVANAQMAWNQSRFKPLSPMIKDLVM